MHYIESGTGPPLVLLHAFPVDARMWRGVRAELEEHCRVITPDQRGLGRSPLDGSAAPSLELVADDLLALLDRLELPRVRLGGCSMGGYVAMSVLRKAPERVAGLVLTSTRADADGAQQRENRLRTAERAESEGTAGWLAENNLSGLLGETTLRQRTDVVDEARGLIEEQPPDGVAWAQRAMAARRDSFDVLRDYAGPALVLRGAEDGLTPSEPVRDMAVSLPNGRLVSLPGAGHLAPLETPAGFAGELREWLAETG
ncbi:pimeloyl-ACP methyl ester carboxylesterase [Actinopolyspora biskrensis]|uniref:Pimeloyl-ACP methyl ester carboxylesterase n=1 Tax=Actinopolyspora biskrensis TaxID=1470178 RepID=A0A852YYB4_9ACTN|nr:pimeloyl-ACP methyl ester carboxylesterase [Actinopolyspora biskrensis]